MASRKDRDEAFTASYANLSEKTKLVNSWLAIKSTPSFAVVVQRGGTRFMAVSQAFAGYLGYSVEEMCRMEYFDLVHPEDLSRTKALATDLATLEQPGEFVNRYRRKDGSYVAIRWLLGNNRLNGINMFLAEPIENDHDEKSTKLAE